MVDGGVDASLLSVFVLPNDVGRATTPPTSFRVERAFPSRQGRNFSRFVKHGRSKKEKGQNLCPLL